MQESLTELSKAVKGLRLSPNKSDNNNNNNNNTAFRVLGPVNSSRPIKNREFF